MTRAVIHVGIAAALAAGATVGARGGAAPEPVSCNQFLLAKETIRGQNVGHESCLMQETEAVLDGRAYKRIDVGITGTVAGYTVRDGVRSNYFTQGPEFVFTQVGNTDALQWGVGRYTAEEGNAFVLLYPAEASAWNGRMWVTAHGAGPTFKDGSLKPWDKNLDPADPFRDISKYERLMIAKGFAVAKTRRPTHRDIGDVPVTLEDGTIVMRNLTELPSHILGFAKVAEHVLEARLGKEPDYTYWYGHSSGARPGRLANYRDGENRDTNGRPLFDGILAGDSGAGLWLPVLMKDGKDVLFTTDAERARFVKQIDLSHLLYWNTTGDDPPAWASNNYLTNKRTNAKLLKQKGLADKHRVYEIHGVSHSGGEYMFDSRRNGDIVILDVARFMDRMIDVLDAWVAKGIEPPPSMADFPEVGDADGDGLVENPGVALPEVACPLGLYYQYPPSLKRDGVASTSWAPFDGQDLEPLNGLGVFVDMNLNRYRDDRETVTQAWRRLGLLGPRESFSRAGYVACVTRVADDLARRGLLNAPVAERYKEEATTTPLPSQ